MASTTSGSGFGDYNVLADAVAVVRQAELVAVADRVTRRQEARALAVRGMREMRAQRHSPLRTFGEVLVGMLPDTIWFMLRASVTIAGVVAAIVLMIGAGALIGLLLVLLAGGPAG